MSTWLERARAVLGAAAMLAAHPAQAQAAAYPHIGRPATALELKAWDIDVRPDFKGLPTGSGSVAKGMVIWESTCSSCHGVFGESNEVFSPMVGGTTAADIASGRVARLNDASFPGRTTLMKLSTLSTLWDYIYRAMPWNAPKSLSPDEVFAVTAYILNLGGVVPDTFTLSDQNIGDVQQLLPNRNGKTSAHALWPGPQFGKARPDVNAAACMSNCATDVSVRSVLPDFARNAHGNLAAQNRTVGAQRGADTTRPPVSAPHRVGAAAPVAPAAPAGTAAVIAVTQKHACSACHGMDRKVVGPGFGDIARKYAGQADASTYLLGRIKGGSAGVWGSIAMPAQALGDADARAIAQWLADGASR